MNKKIHTQNIHIKNITKKLKKKKFTLYNTILKIILKVHIPLKKKKEKSKI